jgi:hypothetical protein
MSGAGSAGPQEPTARTGIFPVGTLALFHRRLVTITHVNERGVPTDVDFVDEAGRRSSYHLTDRRELEPIDLWGEREVFEQLLAATRPSLTWHQSRARDAELWFANPKVGDRFGNSNGAVVEVRAIEDCGRIVCHYRHTEWIKNPVIFENAAAFRKAFSHTDKPGYTVYAFGCTDNEYIAAGRRRDVPGAQRLGEESSPLSNGRAEGRCISDIS